MEQRGKKEEKERRMKPPLRKQDLITSLLDSLRVIPEQNSSRVIPVKEIRALRLTKQRQLQPERPRKHSAEVASATRRRTARKVGPQGETEPGRTEMTDTPLRPAPRVETNGRGKPAGKPPRPERLEMPTTGTEAAGDAGRATQDPATVEATGVRAAARRGPPGRSRPQLAADAGWTVRTEGRTGATERAGSETKPPETAPDGETRGFGTTRGDEGADGTTPDPATAAQDAESPGSQRRLGAGAPMSRRPNVALNQRRREDR